MTIASIRLPKGEWEYDDQKPLGKPGGFGEVFFGQGVDGDVAVKRLKLNAAEAAHRELNIGHRLMERELIHIVPVLDAGQDANSDRYFLIMPVCDYSLQDLIDKAQSGIELEVVRSAVTAIIQGLIEVGDITHRDLKPGNILFHEEAWKIADFGIAKFVEDSTSADTLRDSLSPPYAAPEQWRGERPGPATDVYALGCIIHTLITGTPPFSGSIDDVREQHLHAVAGQLGKVSPKIAAFISHMLRKPPNARPTQERCAAVLPDIAIEIISSSEAQSALSLAVQEVAAKEAKEEAERQVSETTRQQRGDLYLDAERELSEIKARLYGLIKEQSESVAIDRRGALRLGQADLVISDVAHLDITYISIANDSRAAYDNSGWDVLGWSEIAVSCEHDNPPSVYTWSASLLYADRNDGNGFRWYEVAFWKMGQNPKGQTEPFSFKGYEADMYLALSNVMHNVNVAYGPCLIDGEDEEVFIDRWVGLIANAAIGKLTPPSQMPIRL